MEVFLCIHSDGAGDGQTRFYPCLKSSHCFLGNMTHYERGISDLTRFIHSRDYLAPGLLLIFSLYSYAWPARTG